MNVERTLATMGYRMADLLYDGEASDETLRRAFQTMWTQFPYAARIQQVSCFILDVDGMYRSVVDIQNGQLYLESNYMSEDQVASVLGGHQDIVRRHRSGRYEIWIPVTSDKLLGFVTIAAQSTLPELTLAALTAFQQTISLGIRHYLTYRPLKERLSFLQSLTDLSRLITVSDNTEAILLNLVRAGVNLLGFDRATLFVFNTEGTSIERTIYAAVGSAPIELHQTPPLPPFGDEPMELPNLEAVWVPITAHGQRLAALLLDNVYSLDRPPQDALQAVIELGTQVGLALQKSRLIETLNEKATKDDLTGLHRVDYFYDSANAQLARHTALGIPCSLIMLDIDSFKEINDSHGHPAGDAVLVQTAQIIRRTIPSNAIAGRIGGDEFVVLAPGANAAVGEAVGKAILHALASPSGVLLPGGRPLTASIGVAVSPSDGVTVSELIQAADKAMYYSKRCGKARVSVAKR
ncbi:diguanylate cyclase [Alicyclobacillus hesperidum URH17-3-68]|uniref:GGDEF domain-containing protein n=1 Tax=Alicyclobacillus hesperidum TaxID=89784 RepID=A0AA37U9X1_9BACL|nr:sensor domain-containing diguanylate cyclase [Alicyclobacillus hesperidum]EJY56096.1 diguanylate cyclase [Alicyclobacillus hesperidum URH17-3-68]GLV14428.1 hypothetical protein Heshes_21120 [Alicyclobacillus hesperidum]